VPARSYAALDGAYDYDGYAARVCVPRVEGRREEGEGECWPPRRRLGWPQRQRQSTPRHPPPQSRRRSHGPPLRVCLSESGSRGAAQRRARSCRVHNSRRLPARAVCPWYLYARTREAGGVRHARGRGGRAPPRGARGAGGPPLSTLSVASSLRKERKVWQNLVEPFVQILKSLVER
jgi:hypothetical protein